MNEIRTKLIGSNFDTLKDGRKYFHFAVVTGANVISELNDYITRKLPKYFKTFEYYDANVEFNGYSNEGFGVSIIWEIIDAPLNGRFTDKDAANSTFEAIIHDIKELGGESTNYFLFTCNNTMDKEFVIKTLESIRRDIVFKSDLYAGKLLGEAIYDIGLLFDHNNSLSANEGKANIDKLTQNADKPMSSIIQERDTLIEQISSMDKAIKAANEKLAELNGKINQENKNNVAPEPTVPAEEPKDNKDEVPNIREIIEAAQKNEVNKDTEPMRRTEEVTRTEKEVKDKDAELEKINKILDGINVDIEVTDPNEVKENIEKVTTDVKNITENGTTIKDSTVVTDEIKEAVNKDTTATELNINTNTPDTPLPEEKTIYDDMNQKRDIKAYIEDMISKDSEFSGDWEDEPELYQIVLSNDNKAREELSKEEYKEYVDFILSNSLTKEHEPNSAGVYNLRTAKYSSIGAFDFIANGNN